MRWVESDRSRWLDLAALTLGACVAGRPAELLVLPSFLLAWIAVRKRVRLSIARLGVALLVFLAPLLFSASFVAVRESPECLYARDDALRDQILGVTPPVDEQPG